MRYNSTRNNQVKQSAAFAIANGISRDGGLFVPEHFPQLTTDKLAELSKKSYHEIACQVLTEYLSDFTPQEVSDCVMHAYTAEKFGSNDIAPVHPLNEQVSVLELWHGPTCAFKDMALQILPHLLMTSAGKVLDDKKIVILVATSGDTGKAALEGFKDVDGTQILVFYPQEGVSPIQKLQMNTQEGSNVSVCGIEGNFDDAQSGVKAIFTSLEICNRLLDENMVFSSANSINWGRLVPQVVYYIATYCKLLQNNEISLGEKINFVVPTGNFGNILAAYYAKKMGLPIGRLICASNANNVLTDFIRTGTYDKNRKFITTISPSMDILISSNLERLLYDLTDCDSQMVSDLMNALSTEGKYTVNDQVKNKIDALFYGGFCDDAQTKNVIKETFDRYHYLCDTHTAVAVKVFDDYVKKTGDTAKSVIVSTASPYKFSGDVLSALISDISDKNEFDMLEELSRLTETSMPCQLKELRGKAVRFTQTCSKDEMKQVVYKMLGINE